MVILEQLSSLGHNCFDDYLNKYNRRMLIDKHKLALIRDYTPNVRHHERLLTASVAIILRDTDHGTEFLMMQRAFHEKDPWSGQMAFPGGKVDPEDSSHQAAAIREAYEEVGIVLSEMDCVGRIDDVYGLKANGVFSVHVACFIFKPLHSYSLIANEEVADMVWLPCSFLKEPRNGIDFYHPHDASLKMPAALIDHSKSQILWGLSYRMLVNLFDVIDEPITILTKQEKSDMLDIEQLELKTSTEDK